MNWDEIQDGFALWQEHRPQTGEDWVTVAERFIAAGETTERSSPIFAALVLAVRERDKATEEADQRAAAIAEVRRMVSDLRLRETRDLRNTPAVARNSYGEGSYTGAAEVLEELDEELKELASELYGEPHAG